MYRFSIDSQKFQFYVPTYKTTWVFLALNETCLSTYALDTKGEFREIDHL